MIMPLLRRIQVDIHTGTCLAAIRCRRGDILRVNSYSIYRGGKRRDSCTHASPEANQSVSAAAQVTGCWCPLSVECSSHVSPLGPHCRTCLTHTFNADTSHADTFNGDPFKADTFNAETFNADAFNARHVWTQTRLTQTRLTRTLFETDTFSADTF